MPMWRNRLTRLPSKQKIVGSSPTMGYFLTSIKILSILSHLFLKYIKLPNMSNSIFKNTV